MFLILDIETSPDEIGTYSLWFEDTKEKGLDPNKEFPPPITHRVECVGYMAVGDNFEIRDMGVDQANKTSESAALQSFSNFMQQNEVDLVTWNGRAFDLPVIAYRCLQHKIPMAWYSEKYQYRYTTTGHFDLSDYLSTFGASPRPRLNYIAKLLGLPGKMEVAGSDVWTLCKEGKYDEVAAYCITDVIQEYLVFLYVLVLRGVITLQRLEELRQLARDFIENVSEFPEIVQKGCASLIGLI